MWGSSDTYLNWLLDITRTRDLVHCCWPLHLFYVLWSLGFSTCQKINTFSDNIPALILSDNRLGLNLIDNSPAPIFLEWYHLDIFLAIIRTAGSDQGRGKSLLLHTSPTWFWSQFYIRTYLLGVLFEEKINHSCIKFHCSLYGYFQTWNIHFACYFNLQCIYGYYLHSHYK